MSFHDYFSDHSKLYASARPTYPEELFRFVASIAPARERVWDCATGNGQAAIGLSRYFADVEATDASDDQIANAVRASNISYSVRSAEESGFPSRYFDAVCVASAIHWFDYDRFYPEVKRVLRPRGVIAVWGYDHLRVSPEFDEIFDSLIERVIAPHWPPRKKLLHDGYRDVPFPFERIEPPRIEMYADWSFDQLMAFVRSWSGVQRCMAAEGDGFFASATNVLGRAWGDRERVRRCHMDLYILAGRITPT
ncbi:MAG TPA: class I SAM-dependent methyltransferase [Gemmatimonadaceae bacterium]|nr:class I SAM-dependent methyltransferase [Gemmatimonadaceae bacterium]